MPKYAEEILAAVTELQQHPTAEQVFLEMKREHPSIALGTVYKHLNALAEDVPLRITKSGSPDSVRPDGTARSYDMQSLRENRGYPPSRAGERALGREKHCPACREQEKDNIMEEKYHER